MDYSLILELSQVVQLVSRYIQEHRDEITGRNDYTISDLHTDAGAYGFDIDVAIEWEISDARHIGDEVYYTYTGAIEHSEITGITAHDGDGNTTEIPQKWIDRFNGK